MTEENINDENIEEVKSIEAEQEDDLSEKVNSEETEEVETEEGEDEGIDYKSEYERLNGELAIKNERIAKQDKKIIKLKRNGNDENEEEDNIDEPKEEDIDTKVQKAVEKQMSNFVEDTIEEEINKVSSNPEERKLVKWYFTNRIVKSGWSKKEIIEYISDAHALANRGSLIAKNKILSKKSKSDGTAGSPAFAGTPPKPSLKVTEYDRRQAEKFFNGDIKKWMKFKPN